MLDDSPDLLGPEWRFPRRAWDDQDPDRPIDERLALVALSARAAGLPPDVVLRAAPFVDRATASLASGVIVREVRRGLAVAAQLIAEAPWETGPGLVTVTAEDGGPPRVVPTPGWEGPDRDRIIRYLASASAVGLTDTPLDVRWLPLELAATNPPTVDAPRIDPAAFMFMGHAEAPGAVRLWLYKHTASRAYLNLDAECWPWRYDAPSGTYSPYDDPVAALADVHAVPGADTGADGGL
jgi:hypothetical protein